MVGLGGAAHGRYPPVPPSKPTAHAPFNYSPLIARGFGPRKASLLQIAIVRSRDLSPQILRG